MRNNLELRHKVAFEVRRYVDETDGGDDIRMKYRYLDLRRNCVRKNLEPPQDGIRGTSLLG